MPLPMYCRLEHTRKWLVRLPLVLVNPQPFTREFHDRYLACGRLRLRAMIESDGLPTRYKLTKKFADVTHETRPVVSIELTREEHDALRTLPGLDLSKTRHYDTFSGHPFHVDVFAGPLTDLVVCEHESDSLAALHAVCPPPYALVEVTDDPFFTGGALVRTGAQELRARLQTLGICAR